jgi:alkanesulfonate monooxygenase SsuD/methylene tetrahydromethanopterin reductase-like flavin-dependent oxidoreductase (luciferase family)
LKNIGVTPEPVQRPHPPVWLGGFTPAALRRAAGYGDGFTVPGATRAVYDQYVAELKKENRPTSNIRFASAVWCLIVSNDPEKTFAEAADHIIYQANNCSRWLSAAGLSLLSEHARSRATAAKWASPGHGSGSPDKHDPRVQRQSPDHALLFLDSAAGVAAALGANTFRALRSQSDPAFR